MTAKQPITWVNYFDQVNQKKFVPDQQVINGVDLFIQTYYQSFNPLNHSIPMIYLLDYTTGKYIFVSNQCRAMVGFSSDKMIDGGVEFVMDQYHPADLKLFNEQIFSDRLSILRTIPTEQQKDYIFSYNYRIRNNKGEYVNLLQRNSFIQSDAKGNPLLSLGVITNIHHFNEVSPVVQVVEKYNKETNVVDTVVKNSYFLKEEGKVFSKREREILFYLAEGLTSKKIADKLFISEYTVINHKRNMHHKSNTTNTVALVTYAFRQHFL